MTEKETNEAGAPRWVKVFGMVALGLAVLVVVLLVAGRGGHGPGRHTPGTDSGGQTGPPPGLVHEQP